MRFARHVQLDRTRLLAAAQVIGILVIGLTGLFIYAFPGFMSSDSFAQLWEARNHTYSDWHPPAMAALWNVVELFVKGPAGMLVLQSVLFIVGVFRILRRVLPPRAAAIVASAILLFPPVLAPMACIWKDSQMAGFLAMGISLVIDERRALRVAGIVLIVIASALRHNALAATLPIFVLLFRWRDDQRMWRRVAIAVVIWAMTVGTAQLINRQLTKVQKYAWHVSVAPADIIGVIKYAPPLSDNELRALLFEATIVLDHGIQAHARKYYNPANWWGYMTAGPQRVFWWPETPWQRAALSHAWGQLVSEYPSAYLHHRLRVFRALIGLSKQPLFDPVWSSHGDAEHPEEGRGVAASGIQGALADAFRWLANDTPLFRPYLYLFLAFALLAVAWRRVDALALLLSGLSYELALYFIAPSADVRYSHWMLTTTLLAGVIVIAHELQRRRSPRADQIGVADVAARDRSEDRIDGRAP
ncbi:MAG TPA: hypothetical protein VL326_36735 [Kofleriaceae bacterium]|nr:hypothetical protein [Kofleriaceae bacterium]